MEVCYTNELVLPNNCAVIDDEEMSYLEGGATLSYKLSYATTGGAMIKSISYRSSKKWKNISAYDLAAEIWFHAAAYYRGAPIEALCRLLGYNGISNTSFWKSLEDGINIENGLDTQKVCGVSRYVIFRATYAYALTHPGV